MRGLFSRISAAAERSGSVNGLFGADWADGNWSSPSATGQTINQQTAMSCAAVMSCVSILAQDFGKLRPGLVEPQTDGSFEKLPAHPVSALLRRPNDWMTWYEFAGMMMMGRLLRGNAYAVIIRDGRFNPVMLVPINPDRVSVWEAPSGDLFYVVTRSGLHECAVLRHEPLFIPARDIFHLKGLTSNGLVGFSPIALCREAIGLALAQEQQSATLIGNGARPSGILTTDANLTEDTAKRFQTNWNDAHKGILNSGKTAVLGYGLKWQPLTLTGADMEFLASRTFQLQEIGRIFRVPGHMFGEMTRTTGTTLTQLAQEYVNYTLSSHTTEWRQRLAFTFDLDEDDAVVQFDMSILLEGDLTARYQAYRIGLQGVLASNEARRKEGLKPVEGGDKVFRPVNMAPLDSDIFEANALGENGENGIPPPVGSDMGGENPGGGRPSEGNPNPDQEARIARLEGAISALVRGARRRGASA